MACMDHIGVTNVAYIEIYLQNVLQRDREFTPQENVRIYTFRLIRKLIIMCPSVIHYAMRAAFFTA